MLSVYGRLRPGVTLEQARADLATVADRLATDHADLYPKGSGFTAQAVRLGDELTLRARPTLLVLLGAVGCVLLIACANVANLMLARMLRRGRELAMRAALGAGRGRLVRQLLTESTLLAVAGGAIGLGLAAAARCGCSWPSPRASRRARARCTSTRRVLVFTLVVSVLTGMLFGALPALTARPELAEVMKQESSRAGGGFGPRRARGLLVVSQVAFSFMLLIAAGLMLRSFWKLQQVDPGFRSENVLTARVALNWSKYDTDDKVRSFGEELLRKVEADPEVRSAALSYSVPLGQSQPYNRHFQIEGRPVEESARPTLDFRVVSSALLRDDRAAAGARSLLRGRRRPGGAGRRGRERGARAPLLGRQGPDRRARRLRRRGRAMAHDRRRRGRREATTGSTASPATSSTGRSRSSRAGAPCCVRTRVEPTRAVASLGRAVHELDPEQPVDRIRPLSEVQSESVARPRLTAILLGIFALVALVITAAGIGGVLALSVSQRTVEIGVRMAMGAERHAVLRMILEQGLGLVLGGLALGLVGAIGLSSLDRAAAVRRAGHRPAHLRGRGGATADGGGPRLSAARAAGGVGGPARRFAARLGQGGLSWTVGSS